MLYLRGCICGLALVVLFDCGSALMVVFIMNVAGCGLLIASLACEFACLGCLGSGVVC